MHHTTLLRRHPQLVRGTSALRRGEDGATTAEYATVTGAAVGFGALLWKFITSELGQRLLNLIFDWVISLLPG